MALPLVTPIDAALNTRFLVGVTAVVEPIKLYRITIAEAGTLVLSSSVYQGVTRDVYASLYQSDGTEIAFNDDGGGGSQFLITRSILAAGVYYFEARHISMATATFVVDIKFSTVANPSPPIANLVPIYEIHPTVKMTGALGIGLNAPKFTERPRRITIKFCSLITTPVIPQARGIFPTLFKRTGIPIQERVNHVIGGGSMKLTLSGGSSVAGTVKEGATPVSRKVRLYVKETGEFVKDVQSTTGGLYTFTNLPAGMVFFVVSHDSNGIFNAVIADNIITT